MDSQKSGLKKHLIMPKIYAYNKRIFSINDFEALLKQYKASVNGNIVSAPH